MSTRVVVVGAGGFGRETLDVIEAVNAASTTAQFDVLGVLDDAPEAPSVARLAARDVAYLGPIDAWLETREDAEYLIAVGNPTAREALAGRFASAGLQPATVVHPHADVGSVGSIGAGTVICAGVQVSTNVHLGRHVHLNPSVTVGHDSVLGDFVSVNPAATISGECSIDSGALIGAAAVILQGRQVGSGSVVGASACVVRDVPASATVMGVPAR